MKGADEVAAMLRLQALGWGVKRIGREFGCSHHTVKRYVAAGGLSPIDSRSGRSSSRSRGVAARAVPASSQQRRRASAGAGGRELVLTRHTEPEPESMLLLDKFKLELPAQPPPKITADVRRPQAPM